MAIRADLSVRFQNNNEEILYQSDALLSSVDDVEYDDLEESDAPKDPSKRVFWSSKTNINALVWFVRIFLVASVLTCLVLSKLTIIKILAELHILGDYNDSCKQSDQPNQQPFNDPVQARHLAANLYWMLFFIVMVPNLISWIRTVLSGLLSKSPRRPWPKFTALLGVSFKMIIILISVTIIYLLSLVVYSNCIFGSSRRVLSILLYIHHVPSSTIYTLNVWGLQYPVAC